MVIYYIFEEDTHTDPLQSSKRRRTYDYLSR
nr:MAG TPA: hypothetical protein [Caudoviricetes sp.]